MGTYNTINITSGSLQTGGNQVGYQVTAYAAGTAYAIGTASGVLDFGTTDPSIVVDKAGTYLLIPRVSIKYNAATFSGNQTLTLKLRRTNNTPADITNSTTTLTTEIITTGTKSLTGLLLPSVIYTTTNVDDILQIHGNIDALPAAGSLDAVEASLIAIRLY